MSNPHVTAEFHNGRLVVLGCPSDDDHDHNCDAMGCGSVGPHALEVLGPTEAAQELYRLRARVAELEEHAKQVSFAAGLFELKDPEVGPFVQAAPEAVLESVKQLFARVAELEAPPVVPEGYEVVKTDHQVDHDEYETRWELWVRDTDGEPITVAHVDRGNICHPSGIAEPFAAFRALMWAAKHDQTPPHAGDKP